MRKAYAHKLLTLKNIQKLLLLITALLIVTVLVLAVCSRNVVAKSRADEDYAVVEDVAATQSGGVCEYRFTLGSVGHAEALAFFVNHHDVAVYIDGECVYTRAASASDAFITGGGAWVSLPLYESDEGREICVQMTPLYRGYQEQPEFLVGSEIALHNRTLHRALPALMLSLCVMFAGFLLVCLALYNSAEGMGSGRLYALGLMAISAGVWRVSYDRVAYMLLPNYAVALYTLSIISLMGLAIAMLNSLEVERRGQRAIRLCSCAYCGAYILQLLLQALGVVDLRQTLKVIHITILASAAVFVVGSVRQWVRPRAERKRANNYGWMLGVGVLVDLLLYYFADSSFNIVFTLVAILCYAILEGIRLLFSYMEQKKALEEMEIQLTLSRTTTMMSQIRSHFVFNVLNAISGLCKYDPEKADDTVVRFSRYLRSNIDIMEKDGNIPFATDLRQLEDYVALEQVRFGDKIELYTDVEVDNFMIPPLILQPVVENAIKHGLSKKQGSGSIILRTREEPDSIVITVEDDGVGFELSELEKESSVGVRNIRFRLEHLVHGTLNFQSEVGKGTTVTITIPKEDRSCTSCT